MAFIYIIPTHQTSKSTSSRSRCAFPREHMPHRACGEGAREEKLVVFGVNMAVTYSHPRGGGRPHLGWSRRNALIAMSESFENAPNILDEEKVYL